MLDKDRYEDFKEWFMNLEQVPMKWEDCPRSQLNMYTYLEREADRKEIFDRFEEYQKEKEIEKEIKSILLDVIATTPLIPTLNVESNEIYCADGTIDKIYKRLKEKDLIK